MNGSAVRPPITSTQATVTLPVLVVYSLVVSTHACLRLVSVSKLSVFVCPVQFLEQYFAHFLPIDYRFCCLSGKNIPSYNVLPNINIQEISVALLFYVGLLLPKHRRQDLLSKSVSCPVVKGRKAASLLPKSLLRNGLTTCVTEVAK